MKSKRRLWANIILITLMLLISILAIVADLSPVNSRIYEVIFQALYYLVIPVIGIYYIWYYLKFNKKRAKDSDPKTGDGSIS